MNAHNDDHGAGLVTYDDADWPVGRAFAVAICFGAAFWAVVGGVWWAL